MLRRLAAAVLLPLALAGSASGGSVEPPLVSVTTFVINGHGYGHGVGMAQWGALGYAENGLTYDQILAHYFPGTQLGPAPVSTVRVLLTAAAKKLTIASDADFQVRDGVGTVQPVPAGSYGLAPDLDVEGLGQLIGPLAFLPGAAPLRMGRHLYRGSFEITSSGSALTAVNVVGLDAYARGVVSGEMPKDWPLEAVKAQAVAARSYALAQRRSGAFGLYADSRDQVYSGIDVETPVGNAAVDATKGQVVLYDGAVATTYFFSSSGGRTAALADVFPRAKPVPYLVSVGDPYDALSPWHDWGPVVLKAALVSRRLKIPGVSDLQASPPAGHARTVTVVGVDGTTTVPATAIRGALDLRSTWFSVGVLSLARPAGVLLPGSSVVLTGIARRVPAATLEQKAALGAWEAGPEVEPGADGTFSVAVRPSGTTLYRLVADGLASFPLRVGVADGS